MKRKENENFEITKEIQEIFKDFKKETPHKARVTTALYKQNFIRYADFISKNFGVPTKEKLFDFKNIEKYRDYLIDYRHAVSNEGYSNSTIYTYCMAPIAYARHFGIDKDFKIDLPKRLNTEIFKGSIANDEKRAKRDCSPRTYDFNKIVGIRRNELKNLKGNDLVRDESGYWCVRVKSGKGGKFQLQRFDQSKIDFIKSYFDEKKPNEAIFSKKELDNKIDYHSLRRFKIQEAYKSYLDMVKTPEGVLKLKQEIAGRLKSINDIRKNDFAKNGKPKRKGIDINKYLAKAFEKDKNGLLKTKKQKKRVYTVFGNEIDVACSMATSLFDASHQNLATTENFYFGRK